jgi:hypothetical protein
MCYVTNKFGDDPAISSGVIALFVFSVLGPWWPNEESDWTELLLPSGIYVQSFGSIAPVVTKMCPANDDDGCLMIV